MKETIDRNIDHLVTFLPWAYNEPEAIERKIERIKISRTNFDNDVAYNYGIFYKETMSYIGMITLKRTVGDKAFEIGYWIDKDYTNKGLMSEAAGALTKVAFEVEKVERVEIRHHIRNIASRRVPEKLGYTCEATVRTNNTEPDGTRERSCIWMIFKEEYEHSKIKNTLTEAYNIIDEKIL